MPQKIPTKHDRIEMDLKDIFSLKIGMGESCAAAAAPPPPAGMLYLIVIF